MSAPAPRSIFSAFGVELEYMIVDADSLDVRPIADRILVDDAGAVTGDVERGPVSWSNELVSHVVELKVSPPAASFDGMAETFQQEVAEINRRLAVHGARLMPGGMHPWMDPARDTRLWAHEYNEVYAAFDRIFGCQGHGWSNLQSVHLNLPFANDEEFGRLHAAIRLVLPILPALCASSPLIDGRLSGLLDNRLEVYRTNSRTIPSIAGRVIPERAFTAADYDRQIFQRIYADIAPVDPEGVLQHEWLNARGAIARFERNAIEIRVMDVQECPQADVAICSLVVAALRSLVAERDVPLDVQQSFAVEPLAGLFEQTIRTADETVIADRAYLSAFGCSADTCTAGELWRHIAARAFRQNPLDPACQQALDVILQQGPLARRLTRRLERAAQAPFPATLREAYSELCSCLATGTHFEATASPRP